MVLNLFKIIPPSIAAPAFIIFVSLAVVLRFIFSSVYGWLLIAITYYVYINEYTQTQVLSLSELGIWVSMLPAEYKVALLSSSVTIVGFVVAFHTATANWKNQMQAQLRSQAAGEIENFFALVTSNITTAQYHVESMIKTINKIQQGAPHEEASFWVGYLQDQSPKFLASRDTLVKANIEVHRLIGRNQTILSTGFGIPNNLKLAAKCLDEIADKIWIHIPIIDSEDTDKKQSFVNQVNITACTEFVTTCKNNYGKISGLSGGVRGFLTAPIWGFNSSMLLNLLTERKKFTKFVRDFHNKMNIQS